MTDDPLVTCSSCKRQSPGLPVSPAAHSDFKIPRGWTFTDGRVIAPICGRCQMPTKVLSLRQPWAWLVVQGYKPVENRKWNTKLRGAFFIHASKGATQDDWEFARRFTDLTESTIDIPLLEDLPQGGIVGRATLVDVLPPCDDKKHLESLRLPLREICSHRWHIPWQYGFQLEDLQALDFVPMKGALNFFTPKIPVQGPTAPVWHPSYRKTP